MVRCAFLALILTMMAPASFAQLDSGGGPIQVSGENSEVRERRKEVMVSGNVDIVQGEARLRADRVTLNYTGSGDARTGGIGGGFGDISSMLAEGEVFYITPELKARADRGVYDAASETIIMTGEVVLARGEDIATGCELNLNIPENHTTLTGCDGRVRIIIIPSEENTEEVADD